MCWRNVTGHSRRRLIRRDRKEEGNVLVVWVGAIILPAAVLLTLLYLLGVGIGLVLRHRVRVLRGTYRRGYLAVGPDVTVGERIEADPDPLYIAPEPILLPPYLPGGVARVQNIVGITASARADGAGWTAMSATVVELLPGWTVLGPNGESAVDVLADTLTARPETVESSVGTAPAGVLTLVLGRDRQRRFLHARAVNAANELVRARAAELDAAAVGDDEEAGERALARRLGIGWGSFAEAAGAAALAAALADRLTFEQMTALADPWLQRIGLEPRDWAIRSVGRRAAVGRAARGLLRFVERHPTIAAVATVVVIVWGLAVEPILALIAFAVLLAGSFVGAMAMGVRRRRRTRPLDWRPRDISSDGLAVDGESLRRAMRALRLPVHPIVGRYLDRTLIRSTVLVAMPGPVPVDPDRWLDWQRRTGAPVEIGTARARDGSLVSAAWTGPDIVPRSGPMKPDWTLPMPFHDLVHATLDAGATSLLLDPPRRWGLELGERSLAWHAGVGRRDPSDVQGNAQEPGAEASGGAEPSDDADAEGPSAPTS